MATELYQLRIQGLVQQEYNECVIYCQGGNLSAGDVIVNGKDLVASWIANVKTKWLAMLPSDYQLLRLTAKRQDTTGGGVDITEQFQFGAETGTAAATCQATQLCPIVRLIPPMGVKSAGRFFLPCISTSDIEQNVPVAGWVTRLATLMGAWVLTDFGSGTITWSIAIYSRKLDQFHLAQDFDTSPVVGFQRRRQRPY